MRSTAVWAATALAIVAASSHAASGEVRLGPMQFTVQDLDTADGVTAGFAWNSTTMTESYAYAAILGDTVVAEGSDVRPGWMQDASHAESIPNATASGTVSPDLLSSSGSSFVNRIGFDVQAETYANDAGLILAPNTSVTISAFATLTVDARDQCGQVCEFSSARAMLYYTRIGGGESTMADWIAGTASASSGVLSLHRNGTLSITLSNLSSSEAYFSVGALANVGGFAYGPVPEPATSALMLAGLAAIGARRRRR